MATWVQTWRQISKSEKLLSIQDYAPGRGLDKQVEHSHGHSWYGATGTTGLGLEYHRRIEYRRIEWFGRDLRDH